MDTAPNMLWDSKGGGQSVDCSGGVCKNGEFSHAKVVTNDGDII